MNANYYKKSYYDYWALVEMKGKYTAHLLEMIADQNFSKNKEIEQKKRICAQLARGCSESDAIWH